LPHGYRSISSDSATYSTHLPSSRANAMPCGPVSPVSRVVTVAVPAASGRSSMILPSPGALTRRSPPGVQVSIRAPGTRAQTRAVQPAGTVSVCVVDRAPPLSPAGTVSGVLDQPAGALAEGDPVDEDDAGAGGAAAGCSWPDGEDPEHAADVAATAPARIATVKRRRGPVMSQDCHGRPARTGTLSKPRSTSSCRRAGAPASSSAACRRGEPPV